MAKSRPGLIVTFSLQPSIAEFLKQLLEDAGFNAVAAASGSVIGLESIVQHTRADAVVYDIGFPFVNNWQRLERLRGRGPLRSLPVVVTSADARELERQVGVTAIEVFRRPADVARFRRVMCEALVLATDATRRRRAGEVVSERLSARSAPRSDAAADQPGPACGRA